MKIRKVIDIEVPGLGDRIREARGARRQAVLARAAEISSTHWWQIENGRIGALPLDTFLRVQKALGVDLNLEFQEDNHEAK